MNLFIFKFDSFTFTLFSYSEPDTSFQLGSQSRPDEANLPEPLVSQSRSSVEAVAPGGPGYVSYHSYNTLDGKSSREALKSRDFYSPDRGYRMLVNGGGSSAIKRILAESG